MVYIPSGTRRFASKSPIIFDYNTLFIETVTHVHTFEMMGDGFFVFIK